MSEGWGDIQVSAVQEEFDKTQPIPASWDEASEPLRSFCERKHLTLDDLVRTGARMKDVHGTVLAFFYPAGVKYRELMGERKWSLYGSTWEPMKIIPGRDHSRIVIVEGETDAARMSGPDGPGLDVGVMGGGAKNLYDQYVEAVLPYERIYIGLDDDADGDLGARKWKEALPKKNAVRWRPPANDWCAADEIGKPPRADEESAETPLIVWGDDLHELDYEPVASLLDNAMLPDNGMLFIHGWKGAYKSWLAFDLCVALATGTKWGRFNTTREGQKVAVVQFELPLAYYQQRMRMLADRLPNYARPHYVNLGTYSPDKKMRFDITSEKVQEHFTQVFTENGVQVCLFDPIRQMAKRSHYEQEWQSAVVDFCTRLNQQNIAVILTHHDGKSAARMGGGSMLDASAADAIVGTADAAVSIALPSGENWETSKKRNLIYYCRNAETPMPSGMKIEDEVLVYQDEQWFADTDEVEDAQSIN